MTVSLEAEAQQLMRCNPALAILVQRYGVLTYDHYEHPYEGLVCSIIAQQLSDKSFRTILSRIPDDVIDSPDHMLIALRKQALLHGLGAYQDPEVAKILPLPNTKINTLRSLSEAFIAGRINYSDLLAMTRAERHAFLTNFKGIGPWTLDMLDIFVFGESNIFPINDYGIQKALARIHGYRIEDIEPERLEMLCNIYKESVAPFGTCATIYLWELNKDSNEALEEIFPPAIRVIKEPQYE